MESRGHSLQHTHANTHQHFCRCTHEGSGCVAKEAEKHLTSSSRERLQDSVECPLMSLLEDSDLMFGPRLKGSTMTGRLWDV